MKKRILIYFLILFTAHININAQNPISFFEEHIDFKLDSNFFSINGIYSFFNHSDQIVSRQIIFPFAVNTKLIDTIKILDLNSQKLISYNLMIDAVSFNITIRPKDTLDVNIFYRQKISDKNTYILTTTQMWGNLLDNASYTLITPKEMAINSFSYIPDSVKVVGNNSLYKWERHLFSPKVDFDIIIGKMK